jgi:hypothetical protein
VSGIAPGAYKLATAKNLDDVGAGLNGIASAFAEAGASSYKRGLDFDRAQQLRDAQVNALYGSTMQVMSYAAEADHRDIYNKVVGQVVLAGADDYYNANFAGTTGHDSPSAAPGETVDPRVAFVNRFAAQMPAAKALLDSGDIDGAYRMVVATSGVSQKTYAGTLDNLNNQDLSNVGQFWIGKATGMVSRDNKSDQDYYNEVLARALMLKSSENGITLQENTIASTKVGGLMYQLKQSDKANADREVEIANAIQDAGEKMGAEGVAMVAQRYNLNPMQEMEAWQGRQDAAADAARQAKARWGIISGYANANMILLPGQMEAMLAPYTPPPQPLLDRYGIARDLDGEGRESGLQQAWRFTKDSVSQAVNGFAQPFLFARDAVANSGEYWLDRLLGQRYNINTAFFNSYSESGQVITHELSQDNPNWRRAGNAFDSGVISVAQTAAMFVAPALAGEALGATALFGRFGGAFGSHLVSGAMEATFVAAGASDMYEGWREGDRDKMVAGAAGIAMIVGMRGAGELIGGVGKMIDRVEYAKQVEGMNARNSASANAIGGAEWNDAAWDSSFDSTPTGSRRSSGLMGQLEVEASIERANALFGEDTFDPRVSPRGAVPVVRKGNAFAFTTEIPLSTVNRIGWLATFEQGLRRYDDTSIVGLQANGHGMIENSALTHAHLVDDTFVSDATWREATARAAEGVVGPVDYGFGAFERRRLWNAEDPVAYEDYMKLRETAAKKVIDHTTVTPDTSGVYTVDSWCFSAYTTTEGRPLLNGSDVNFVGFRNSDRVAVNNLKVLWGVDESEPVTLRRPPVGSATGSMGVGGGDLSQFGTLPEGAVVGDVRDHYVVYDHAGESRIRFAADQSYQVAEISANSNGSDRTIASVADDGRVYVFEGNHRARAAALGREIPVAYGGVEGAPGVLDYGFEREAMAGPAQTQWGRQVGVLSSEVRIAQRPFNVDQIVSAFNKRFGVDPDSVMVVGSRAEAVHNPSVDLSNSDWDVIINSQVQGLSKNRGPGFELMKDLNPGYINPIATRLGEIGSGKGNIQKAGLLDLYFNEEPMSDYRMQVWPYTGR